ncbi:unnamed protein product [Chrysoparadoxa australica]
MTDEKHPTWILPLADHEAKLVLTPCPGTKGVKLDASLGQLKDQHGVKAVVSSTTTAEMEKLGVSGMKDECEKHGLVWLHCPINDDGAPKEDFAAAWPSASQQVHQIIKDGGNVALHCKGGNGRTGLLASHILLEMGVPVTTVEKSIKALRPGALTNPEHRAYVSGIASGLNLGTLA